MRIIQTPLMASLVMNMAFCCTAMASNQAIFAEADQVDMLVNPSPAPSGNGPHAKYEGLFYNSKAGHVGEPVEDDAIIRTAVGGKAKLLFDDGDQLFLGSATSYRISKPLQSEQKTTVSSLFYGAIRMVVTRYWAPNKNVKVLSHGSVMGVRGTDLSVAYQGEKPVTKLTVLRGTVDMQKKPVHTGETAALASGAASAPKVEKTDRVELAAIRELSTIKSSETSDAAAAERVKKAEERAREATSHDFAKANSLNLAELSGKSSDELNALSLEHVYKTAPEHSRTINPGSVEQDIDSKLQPGH